MLLYTLEKRYIPNWEQTQKLLHCKGFYEYLFLKLKTLTPSGSLYFKPNYEKEFPNYLETLSASLWRIYKEIIIVQILWQYNAHNIINVASVRVSAYVMSFIRGKIYLSVWFLKCLDETFTETGSGFLKFLSVFLTFFIYFIYGKFMYLS
jgi:hypothetical protein